MGLRGNEMLSQSGQKRSTSG